MTVKLLLGETQITEQDAFKKTRQRATSTTLWARFENTSEIRRSSGIIWKPSLLHLTTDMLRWGGIVRHLGEIFSFLLLFL